MAVEVVNHVWIYEFMNLRRPRIARFSNIGLVHIPVALKILVNCSMISVKIFQLIEAKWHIHASLNWVIIGSNNGLSPVQRQAIIWTNAGILLIGPLDTNFSEILIVIQTLFKKLHL